MTKFHFNNLIFHFSFQRKFPIFASRVFRRLKSVAIKVISVKMCSLHNRVYCSKLALDKSIKRLGPWMAQKLKAARGWFQSDTKPIVIPDRYKWDLFPHLWLCKRDNFFIRYFSTVNWRNCFQSKYLLRSLQHICFYVTHRSRYAVQCYRLE